MATTTSITEAEFSAALKQDEGPGGWTYAVTVRLHRREV